MLELTIPIEFDGPRAPFLLKLSPENERLPEQSRFHFPDKLEFLEDGSALCAFQDHVLKVHCPTGDSIAGDVIIASPSRQNAQRIIRSNSKHNTILLTERCDQMCAMCSQPPKDKDYLHLFDWYADAILLSERNSRIGISGGEPTLHIEPLLSLLNRVAEVRTDVSFHILTNAQHFSRETVPPLKAIHDKLDILWGVPLYSNTPGDHDKIVGKVGAFETLMNNMFTLASTGAKIELRTVLMARNALDLPALSKFIADNIPFISFWAIMAMEPIGYAKANREQLFFDHSTFPEPLVTAIEHVSRRNIGLCLYNFPMCTIPEDYRSYCAESISDWKKKYLEKCDGCIARLGCTGFFEWYNEDWFWEGVSPIHS